jgi:MFS family permease
VVAAVVGMSGGFAVVAVAPSLPVVATGLLLLGTAASVYHLVALALLSRGVGERRRGFTYHGVAGSVGTVVGPLGVAVRLTFFEWRTVAAMLVVPALVGVAGQYAGGRLIDEYDTVRLLDGSFLALVVISLSFVPASNTSILPLLVVCGLLGFAVYGVAPIYQATVAEYVPSEIRGTLYGVTYLSIFGVGALGAVVAGSVLTWARPAVLFALLAASRI